MMAMVTMLRLSKSFKMGDDIEAEVTVQDSKGKKDKEYSKKIDIVTDNSDVVFSLNEGDVGKSSLSVMPNDGIINFIIKFKEPTTANISVQGEGLNAAMFSLEVKKPLGKTLILDIQDNSSGKSETQKMEFKLK